MFNIRNGAVGSGIGIFTESSSSSRVSMNMPAQNHFGPPPLIGEMYQAFGIAWPREYIDSIVIPRIYCQPL